MNSSPESYKKRKQTGAVLAIGLVVLLVLTLLGTGSINSVRMEEKMTANVQSLGMAFEGAEAALVQGETDIRVMSLEDIQDRQIPVNDLATVDDEGNLSRWWEDFSIWDGSGQDGLNAHDSFLGSGSSTVGVVQDPSYVIEYIGRASPSLEFSDAVLTEAPATRRVYRVTAFSYGADTRSSAVVESIYAK